MKQLIKSNNGKRKRRNAGFTLVEMIVVLTIMAIMMGGAVWGVTGWIAHYEYISCEQKARTIYMAAQSALSAAESRGALNEYMAGFAGSSDMHMFAKESGDDGLLDKETYGIPVTRDNENEIHEYGYLSVKQGDYASGSTNVLYKMLEPYVSDSEQLNASIVVEFDITAKKVYAVFYSTWATSIEYDSTGNCVERGTFYITKERRNTPEFRENYQVGYYGADQVNVVKLDNLPQLKADCMLHNEETLYLTMNSDDDNAEEMVEYTVSLYEDTNPIVSTGGFFGMFGAGDSGNDSGDGSDNGSSDDQSGDNNANNFNGKKLLCSFSFNKDTLSRPETGSSIPPQIVYLDVDLYGEDGKKIEGTANPYPFILSFVKGKDEEGNEQEYFKLVLDAVTTELSYAELDETDQVTNRNDKAGFSITRLVGAKPMNIFARVSVEPMVAGIYSSGLYKESEVENSLFETKKKEYKDNEYFDNASAYLMRNNRHFANIRYAEDYAESVNSGNIYAMVNDIDWNDVEIYNRLDTSNIPYLPIAKTDDGRAGSGFPMISALNADSEINGAGWQYSNMLIENDSSVTFERDGEKKIINDPVTGLPVNKAKTLGIIGINKGVIRRLILANADVTAITKDDYSNTTQGSDASEATKMFVYSDTLEAVGLLCGRNEGSLKEIYFDKDCSVNATVFANLNDADEAEADGVNDINNKYLNEMYGCGVGMAAGTVLLNDNTVIDRVRTSGEVVGKITGSDYKETPDISDVKARADIYNDESVDANNKSNAQYYSYGVGGTFGYVYGEFKSGADSLGIGVDKESVKKHKADDSEYYLSMYNRVESKETVDDENGNHKEVVTIKKGDQLLFDEDDDRSIINKADVTGESSFVGGIAGNIYISGLSDNMVNDYKDSEEDVDISEDALTQFVNCHNYGDTTGNDFVGGVVGINGTGGYIAECSSYGSPSATKGVSAGITSENYGYIEDCLVDRAPADEDNTNKNNVEEPYVPIVKGNMVVAGAITSVNHENCVVKNCKCAISEVKDDNGNSVDNIRISGNEMDTFGYLVGENYGVVNGGKAGEYIGYNSKKKKMTIGGAVGTNENVVKNVTVTSVLEDNGEAECIGGVAGLNLATIKYCKFGGTINKSKSSTEMTIGGITGRNGDGTVKAKVIGCYLIGGQLNVTGSCNYVETDTSEAKIRKSSKVGGICGVNYSSSTVDKCYITGLSEKSSNDDKAVTETDGQGIEVVSIIRQSKITVKDGMAGGVTAVNYGTVTNCGYTDKAFYEENDEFVCSSDTSDSAKDSYEVSANMALFAQAKTELTNVSDDDSSVAREAVNSLNELLIDVNTGELTDAAKKTAGYLTDDKDHFMYALPKYEMNDPNDNTHWDAYNADTNQFILSMGYKKNGVDVNGKGCIGGIVGFNTEYGRVDSCATGRWLVENYMPRTTYDTSGRVIGVYDATGGVIGNNAADADYVKNLINFAYVRIELPIIYKNSSTMNLSDASATNSAQDNRFHYVGGVIGTQYNKTKTDWCIDRCVNVGTIVNYYGHNTGGVLGQACGMGGTVQYCYNYGMTMTGYSTGRNGSKSGTAGGIVSHYTDLEAGQVSQVLHCNNYGVISFPMQGLDFDTSQVKDIRGNAAANDVGGIVGEISAPLSTSLYTVNIVDCVNGKCSRVYSYSKCGGIIGQIGCLTKDNVNTGYAVNSLFVNVDTCRNYSSDFWTSYSEGRKVGTLFSMTGGGITAGRDQFDDKTDEATWTGYTTIRNCFSLRMNGDYDYGKKDEEYSTALYTNNYNVKKNNGIIAFSKTYNPISDGKNKAFCRVFKYCGNNYYMDESSFQYTNNNGFLLKSGYDKNATKADSGFDGDLAKVNAIIATVEPEVTDTKKLATVNSKFKSALINKVNDPSLFLDDYSESRLASERIISASYYEGDVKKYVLFVEPKGVYANSLSVNNTWIDESEGRIKIKTTDGKIVSTNILYKGLVDKDSSGLYDKRLIDYFFFRRIKNDETFRKEVEAETGYSLDDKVNSTRLPILDEYDIDYFDIDNQFMEFIEEYKAKGPDIVYDVNVKKSDNNEYYEATWKIKSDDENTDTNPSATKFDVTIQYIRLDAEDTFDSSKINDYLADNLVTDYEGYTDEPDNVYGTKTVFKVPDDLMSDDGQYYAVVRVRDSRDEDGEYSKIENTEAVIDPDTNEVITPALKSYVPLEPKMPTPEFEIVKYTIKNKNNIFESKWMLHLINADDFKAYASLPGFEIGAYQLNNDNTPNMAKAVKLTKEDIIDEDGNVIKTNLLNNAVEIGSNFTTNKVDHKLYGYAKADDHLDADLYSFTVYIPNVVEPSMEYTLDPEPDAVDTLNNDTQKPEYSGTLTYTKFNGTTVPPLDQVFRVELYGVKSVEENGVTKKWHETVAYKDYPLSVGDTAEVNIGYYDVPSGIDLKEYDSFNVACWYAAPGDGYKVYNYFEITDEWKTIANADRTVRSSGYIKDLSTGTENNYFHTTKLPVPKFKAICMARKRSDSYAERLSLNDSGQSPEWYIVLTNADEYPAGTQIVRDTETNVFIDLDNYTGSGNATLNKMFDYAAPIQTGWNNSWFWAKAEGNLSSDKGRINPSNNTTALYKDTNLRNANGFNVNLSADCDYYTDEDAGSFTLDENNNLSFKGRIRYNCNASVKQYYRYEIYALDENEQQVTLYLSPDIEMKKGNNNTTAYPYTDYITRDIEDVSAYHDFHFAVWYSQSEINNVAADMGTGKYTYHYTQITENVAKTFDCYHEDEDIFVNPRDEGLLIDYTGVLDGDAEKPSYYYVTALADKTYGDNTFTENYLRYVLYREAVDTVSTIKENAEGNDDISVTEGNIKYVEWSLYPNYYTADSSDIECKIDEKVYQVPKGYEPSGADELLKLTENEVDGKKKVFDDTTTGTTHFRVMLPNSVAKQLQWSEYDYYAIVRVKDKDVLSELDAAYSRYVCFPMNKPLPIPEVSVSLGGYSGDVVRLDNYADYDGYDLDKVTIYVEVEGKQKYANIPYEISIDPEKPGSLKNQNAQVKIPYLALMEKYNNANGSKLKLVAYAIEKDDEGNEVDRSASLTTKVYIPQGGNPVVDKTHMDLTDTDYTVDKDSRTISFHTSLNYYIEAANQAQRPSEAQGFAVALVGKPINKIDGKYDNPVILAKTTQDQYVYIKEGDTDNIDVELTIPEGIDLNDYNYNDYGIFVWCVYGKEDLVPSTRIDLTEELFEKYYNKQGVAIDYSNGIDEAEYCIERILYNDGYKELPKNYNSVNRGVVKLEFDPDKE